ncbi:MAG: hypothetical protein AAGC70_02700 [Pseudomonadota bacterium]
MHFSSRPRHPGRWVLAALAATGVLVQSMAAKADDLVPGLLPKDITFTKSARQLSCNYVEFVMRFGATGRAGVIDDATRAGDFDKAALTFTDRLSHAGLKWVRADVTGDVAGPRDGAVPAARITTDSHTGDTLKIDDLRFSAKSVSGAPLTRHITIRALAKIDRGKFASPTTVASQATIRAVVPGRYDQTWLSDTEALASSNPFKGQQTRVSINMSDCPTLRPVAAADDAGDDAVGDDPATDSGDDGAEDGGDDGDVVDADSEACFKTDDGEVDCGDAPGTYVYTMPVDAEYAGRFIELTSLTPGVFVLDLPQLVPPGGGELTWTIVGAAPGMTVELVANGLEGDVKALEDVENALTLCCTQTIKIEIPEDLPCDLAADDAPPPDVEVLVNALVPSCTLSGGCKFAIEIKNVGASPYEGPLHLRETLTPRGGTFESVSPGWSCGPSSSGAVQDVACQHQSVRLRPGQRRLLEVSIKPSATSGNYIQNCARFDYASAGVKPFGKFTNDAACARIPICEGESCAPPPPPTEGTPLLELSKAALAGTCFSHTDGTLAVCRFGVTVRNVGTGLFAGPASFEDQFQTPVTRVSASGSTWRCSPDGASGKINCKSDRLVLPPGAEARVRVTGWVKIADVPDRTVKNCARLFFEAGFGPRVCARMSLPEPPEEPGPEEPGDADIEIGKACKPSALGAPANCRITVTNHGTAVHSGAITVNEVNKTAAGDTVPLQTVTPDVSADWRCGSVPSSNLSCIIDGAKVATGETRFFDVTFNVPAGSTYKNCASGMIQGATDVHDLNEACVSGTSADITVDKTGPGSCEAGKNCTFAISISNNAKTDFSGPIAISDVLSNGGATVGRLDVVSISPSLGCGTRPTQLPFSCDATVKIRAGETKTHKVVVRMPDSAKEGTYRNCAMVSAPDLVDASSDVGGNTSGSGPDSGPKDVEGPLSCHSFTLTTPTPVCTPPLVLRADGNCACPRGQIWNGRRCVGEPEEPPITIIPPPPVVIDPPVCRNYEESIYQRAVANRYRRQGYTVRYLRNAAGRVWCISGRPERPECDYGEQTVYSARRARRLRNLGARVRRVTAGSETIWCAGRVPPPLKCFRNEIPIKDPRTAARYRRDGYIVRTLANARGRLWCARETYPCRGNERLIRSAREAQVLRSRGAPVRQVRYKGDAGWCVGPVPPIVDPCRRYERTVRDARVAARLRKTGYIVRVVNTRTGRVWCARPGRPPLNCGKDRLERNAQAAERYRRAGYRVRRISSGRLVAWCIGGRPTEPPCINGQMTRTSARGYYCQCGPDVRRVAIGNRGGARCVGPRPGCSSNERTVRSRAAARRLQEQGYRVRRVSARLWCASGGPIVCQRGQVRRGRSCVWPPCPPGQIRRGARCLPGPIVCLRGQIRRGNKCIWPPCPPGQIRRGPRCVVQPCPPNTRRQGRRCVPIVVCRPGQIRRGNRCVWRPCPPGQIRRGARCVAQPCPPNTRRQGRRCVPVVVCRPGQIRRGNRCVSRPCPPGQVRRGARCVVRPCPPNTRRQGRRCVPIVRCRPGQIRRGNRCVSRPCPPGQIRRGPRCVRVIQRCRPGLVGRPPNCRRPVVR